MLTVDALREYGADVDTGLARCLNNEAFYLRMVSMTVPDTKLDELEAAIAAKDLDRGFELAHAMKGMYSNLALTPILNPVNEMTELLRARTDTDYSKLLAEAKLQKEMLNRMAE
ncbi:MAG: Hpt domain-containing protein [Lachnospiraceae bacterium]|nr:Hpt domain-containing protein [Lachnospiraceae bacterium]